MEYTRRSVLTALGLGAFAAATGCAASPSGDAQAAADGPAEGEITLLTPIFEGSTGKQLLEGKLLPAFLQKNPNVKVKVDYTTYNALNEKLTTGLASGLMPDVVMLGVGWIPPFAHKKVLAPLPDSLASRFDYEDRVLEPSRYDGKLYALPLVLDTRIVTYRKDMFAEAGIKAPPKDWAELREMSKELARSDGSGKLTRVGFDPFSIDLRQCWETFLFANDGNLFDEAGKEVRFNDDRGVEALQLFLDVVKDKSADFSFKTSTGQPSTLAQGRSAMMMANNSLWVQLKQQNPELLKEDKVGAFVLANKVPAMLQGGTLVARSASSKHASAAQALVEFLGTPESILPTAEQRGSVPGVQDLRTSEYVQNNDFVKLALDNMSKARSEGGTAAWMEIREKIKVTLETAVVGQRTAKEAIDELANLSKQAISRL
ncbi:carbohydrate ABC transporter substrate-binding protein (CUT1 family) [Kribbella amoyensis]|uniref:Carbohydrate ABC transporter substrate-binding protein (CUT1 family) n=1 Tax=Kribbella amoyensis TaxID=996641 RepID=A0A561BL50_9ACTN|nr:extracellular solute-binding protein [Kribbella amoyensis]TWD79585.1 carbohydrate ABC transporter substrate-binding protein (CUT1 family) [Kribbella amoyensis]